MDKIHVNSYDDGRFCLILNGLIYYFDFLYRISFVQKPFFSSLLFLSPGLFVRLPQLYTFHFPFKNLV